MILRRRIFCAEYRKYIYYLSWIVNFYIEVIMKDKQKERFLKESIIFDMLLITYLEY